MIPSSDLRFSFLDSFDLVDLHDTFLRAFSDYFVPMNLDRAQFKELLTRRGAEASLSVAAFDGSDPVGFNINAFGNYQGVPTIYDVGTGMIPEFRRHGIARKLFEFSLSRLKSSGAKQYVLEVFQNNSRALPLYQKVGFEIRRELEVFQTSIRSSPPKASRFLVEQITADWDRFQKFWDWSPSWQNSIESMKRSAAGKIIAGIFHHRKLIGYGIIFPGNADIAQFAIDPEHRRRRAGTTLIEALLRMAGKKAARVVNVDSAASGTISFLDRFGFKLLVSQYEMAMKLNS
jgi:ribosomal protein S18 acetylase RimI-like enzyme